MPVIYLMSMNADPNASFSLSTWILKSPTIKTLSAASTNSDIKSSNSIELCGFIFATHSVMLNALISIVCRILPCLLLFFNGQYSTLMVNSKGII